MIYPQSAFHVLSVFTFLWMHSSFGCFGLLCFMFLVYWFSCISFFSMILLPTCANQCAGGFIRSITSCELDYALLTLGVVVFSFLFCFFIWLVCFSLSCFFPLLVFLCTCRLVSAWNCVWLLETSRVKSKRNLYSYQHLVIYLFPLFMRILCFFYSMIPWWKMCSF